MYVAEQAELERRYDQNRGRGSIPYGWAAWPMASTRSKSRRRASQLKIHGMPRSRPDRMVGGELVEGIVGASKAMSLLVEN